MFVKRLLLLFSSIILISTPVSVCYAEGNTDLVQTYAQKQCVDAFVTGNMNSDNITCKVSNQTAEVMDSGLLTDKGIPIHTTILLDISTSMPSKVRGNVKSYIDLLIQNIGENEQYKIVAFGEQLTVLQNGSSDYYELTNAATKIEFNEQQSKIYDAIYNTIPDIAPIDDMACYYRTIVITDGVDDTVSGITKEELFLKLQAETYPIDVVSVTTTAEMEQNKELAALSRMSSGRYTNISPETDVNGLIDSLALNNLYWIRINVPGVLLDGSTRQVNISDEVNSIQFDIKIPVFDAPIVEDGEPTQRADAESTSASLTVNETKTTLDETETMHSPTTSGTSGEYSIVIYIGVGIGIVMLVAVLIAFFIINKKKKKTDNHSTDYSENSTFNDKTELLINSSTNEMEGNPSIRLRNANDPNQVWDIALTKDVLIGRGTQNQICIDDASISPTGKSSVSREQCKIYIAKEATVENLSQSNKTLLNGQAINSPISLKVGDKLKCGRITLIVDSLYNSESQNLGELNKGTMFINI